MKTDELDELIVALASDAGAVRALPPPAVRAAFWAPVAVAAVMAGVLVIGIREDIAAASSRVAYLTAGGVLVAAAGLAALTSLLMAVPGRGTRGLRILPVALVAAWTVGLAGPFGVDADAGQGVSDWLWMVCIAKVVSLAFVPALTLGWMVRRAAPLDARGNAAFVMLAAAALAAAGVQVACPIDLPGHLLLGHALPVLGLSLLAMLAGPVLLKDSRG